MAMLRAANEQLFSRPPEEHYSSFAALKADATAQRDRCTEHDAKDTTILFSEHGEEVHFGDLTFRLTPYAMAQIAAMETYALTNTRALLGLASRIDPGNYRLHLKIGGREHDCRAAALFPYAYEAARRCR